jgi:hypothetical protein
MFSRTSKAARVSWSVAYAFFLLAGVVAFFAPSQLIVNALIEALAYAWATFLTVGGGLCFGGKLKGNWAGEILGLPLLSAASYIFGILLLVRGSSSATIAIGAMFCGVGTTMVGRWIEIRRLAKYNQGVNSGD